MQDLRDVSSEGIQSARTETIFWAALSQKGNYDIPHIHFVSSGVDQRNPFVRPDGLCDLLYDDSDGTCLWYIEDERGRSILDR